MNVVEKEIKNHETLTKLEELIDSQISSSFLSFIQNYSNKKLNPLPYIWVNDCNKGYLLYKIISFCEEDDNNVLCIMDKMKQIQKIKSGYIPFGMTKDKQSLFLIHDTSIFVYDGSLNELVLISKNFTSFCRKYIP